MLAIFWVDEETSNTMSNFIHDFDEQRREESIDLERLRIDDEREKQRIENEAIDKIHKTDIAVRKAVAERKITLDWAWAAAELLNESGVIPDLWTYEYKKRRMLFGHTAMKGIAAEGWQLFDWQNTYYYPSLKHVLFLSPRDENNSGIHLRFFSQPHYSSGEPIESLKPENVHELSRTPLSDEDMPWPGMIDEDAYNAIGGEKISIRRPWKDGSSLRFASRDIRIDLEKNAEKYGGDLEMFKTIFAPEKTSYDHYASSGTEKAIRTAIARVAARYIPMTAEDISEKVKDRPAID